MDTTKIDYPTMYFKDQQSWQEWLANHHDSERGVWIKFAKKATGIPSVNFSEALDVALCFGWIDGQSKSLDGTYYLQKFTPRGPKSTWSKKNRENIERLLHKGKMHQAGLTVVEAAKKDGRWDMAYDSPANMVIPEDFITELKKHKKAYEFYLTLNKSNTYAVGWRLQTAKKPETRERRMKALIALFERGEKLH